MNYLYWNVLIASVTIGPEPPRERRDGMYLTPDGPAFGKATAALFLAGFVTFGVLYATQPLLPVFARQFHVSPLLSSFTVSVTTLAMAPTMLVAAGLSARLARKRVIGWSMILSATLTGLAGLSPSFAGVLALRALSGAALAFMPVSAMAYLEEEFHPASLGRAMGVYIGGSALGGMTGRILVSFLTAAFSWQTALAVVGLAAGGLAVLSLALLPSARNTPAKSAPSLRGFLRTIRRHAQSPPLRGLYQIGFLLMGGFVTLFNYVPFALSRSPYNWNPEQIGLLFVVYVFGSAGSARLGARADRHPRRRVLMVGMGLMLTGVLFTLAVPVVFKVVGLALATFGFFGAHAVASSSVGHSAGPHKAEASALYLLFYYLGSALAGTTGGFFWAAAGWPGVVLLIALLIATGLAVAARQPNPGGGPRRPGDETPVPAAVSSL